MIVISSSIVVITVTNMQVGSAVLSLAVTMDVALVYGGPSLASQEAAAAPRKNNKTYINQQLTNIYNINNNDNDNNDNNNDNDNSNDN